MVNSVNGKQSKTLFPFDNTFWCCSSHLLYPFDFWVWPCTSYYIYYFICSVDATRESGRLGRLLNHSRNGNCRTKLVDIGDRPYLILVAKRDIELGEELLYDYGDRNKDTLHSHPWLALMMKFEQAVLFLDLPLPPPHPLHHSLCLFVVRHHVTRIKSEIIKAPKARKILGKLNWAIQLSTFLSSLKKKFLQWSKANCISI